MRLGFFGSGEFGVPTLRCLAGDGHDIAMVVSQPDRPSGRGGKTRPTPLAAAAKELGLPVLCPEKPNAPGFIAEFAEIMPDLCVVVAYGHLIKRDLLAVPRLGFVNLHASLLPAYRGAAPVPWAILNGDAVSGVTVFRLDEHFDTGGILAAAELPIDAADTSGSYLSKLSGIGAALMADTVAALFRGEAAPRPQDGSGTSQAPKFRKEDGLIDWTGDFAGIERKTRAFQPWPLAHTFLETTKGRVRINVLEMSSAAGNAGTPGRVVTADVKNGLVIMTGTGAARLGRIQPEGKRPMSDIDFLRGNEVRLA